MTEQQPPWFEREQDEEYKHWVEQRRGGIGASDAAVALGFSPFKSPATLWAEKCGLIKPEPPNEHTYWGQKLEPLIIDEYERRTGEQVFRTKPYMTFWGDLEQQTPLFATPDAFIGRDQSGHPLEAKATDSTSEIYWLDGPPLVHQIQVQMQIEILQAPSGVIAVLIGKRFDSFHVERCDRFIRAMMQGLDEFWGYVERREAPPIDWSYSTKQTIAALYPEDSGATIEADEELTRWATAWETARRLEKEAGKQKYKAANNIAMRMGTATWASLPDGRFLQLRLEKRKGYTREVEPWEGRVLRAVKQRKL